jgi:hypothetical protein
MEPEIARRANMPTRNTDPRGGDVGVKQDPAPDVKDVIGTLSERSVCGQNFTLTWTFGPKKGLPVTVYCVEPLCVDTGKCEGPRFVPHLQQYTTTDTDDPRWGPRKVGKQEAIAAVREVAKVAERKGAIRLLWDDRTIWEFVTKVWSKTLMAVRGDGDPRRGWTR